MIKYNNSLYFFYNLILLDIVRFYGSNIKNINFLRIFRVQLIPPVAVYD